MNLPRVVPASARVAAALLAATLAGCAGDVVTNPDAVKVEPFGMSAVRTPQTIAFRNAFEAPAKYEITSRDGTWVVDLRQLTDTAIVALRRALENKGITAAAQSAKTVTLRVQVRGAWTQIMPGHVLARARLTLDAQFGDGSTAWIEAEDGSAFGATRAFEGALRVALQRLLFNPAFVAYVTQ
jgi:hypothetical protein